MILNDHQIASLCQTSTPLIEPYFDKLITSINTSLSGKWNPLEVQKVISFGQSSFGYDLRISPIEFKIFHRIPGEIVDPKNFNSYSLYDSPLVNSDNGNYFVLPAHTYGLGLAMEKLNVPRDVTVIFLTKSTYARCGICTNVTPAEAGWRGYLTIEISNLSDSDCRIYAGEGIVQALFLQGESCKTSYDDRKGKYQDQPASIVMSKV